MSSKLTPTQEQQEILDAFKEHKVMKINACAGSGKSSTLKMLSEQNIQPSLYICYNKTVATEAKSKFPEHVDCRTAHSLAYSSYGVLLQHKLTRKNTGKYENVAKTVSEIVKYYSIDDFSVSKSASISSRTVATLVKGTVTRFQNSKYETITGKCIPKNDLAEVFLTYKKVNKEDFIETVVKFANKLWCDRINPNSNVLAEHDSYLKLWQLSKPKLPYEIIYFDESQDANPVILDVILNQDHCKCVYVGDTYQSIYQWRQAVNAMEKIEAPIKVLSQSFRFGENIADLATYIIDGGIHIKGNPKIDSELSYVLDDKYTVVCRTNSHLIDVAVELLAEGKNVKCEIDTTKFESLLKSCEALYTKDYNNVKDEDIALYSKWEDLLEALDEHVEYKRIVKIVLSKKTKYYLYSLSKLKKQSSNYDVLLITAHKSKGMEWDNVIIGDDFPIDIILKLPNDPEYNQQEVNLFYVACTRAKLNLELPDTFYDVYSDALNEFNKQQTNLVKL